MTPDPGMRSKFRSRKYDHKLARDVTALLEVNGMSRYEACLVALIRVPMHNVVRMRKHLLRGLSVKMRQGDAEVQP